MEWTKVVYKRIADPFISASVLLGITANQITVFNHFITLTLGCYGFSRGTYWGGILGLSVCLFNGFLDYLDGDVARARGEQSKFGVWLDSGFDVIIQNAVMGAIAIGCFKMGLPIIWIILFFVANAANNLVSFHYNQTFGFDSANGNSLFRQFMEVKKTPINRFFKNIIDPTSSFFGLATFTFRYWIVAGVLSQHLIFCFIAMTVIANIKWFIMFTLYAMHQAGSKKLYVLQALAILDEERNEFFRIRYGK